MYYKIINKESQIYKDLFKMRTEEIEKAKRNEALIVEKAGSNFTTCLMSGHVQQNFRRVPQFIGFVFDTPETLKEPKAWKKDKEENDVYVPNRRTKAGQQWSELLANGLEAGNYRRVYEFIKLEGDHRSFVMPFLDIFDETLLLFLDPKDEVTNEDIIEITQTEFKQIAQDANEKQKS